MIIKFPKSEEKEIQKKLNEGKIISTIRCCNELEKYKKNKTYETNWKDKIIILEVKTYSNPEDIPTWNKLTKGQKISVKMGKRYGKNKWEHIKFKKIK